MFSEQAKQDILSVHFHLGHLRFSSGRNKTKPYIFTLDNCALEHRESKTRPCIFTLASCAFREDETRQSRVFLFWLFAPIEQTKQDRAVFF